jgi:ribosomal protein S18 acetylase RimI-like enzyme
MSTKTELQIRSMLPGEMAFAINLAANEGWNPGLHDAECFYAADAEGFFIGMLDNKPIGCISAVSYAGRFGFIGLYIVRPEYRGRGFGMQLWQAAMQRLSGQNIGLDGVVAQQANYAKSGFRLAHQNVRYQGTFRKIARAASIVAAGEISFEKIRNYDRQIFPGARDAFLRKWLSQPGAGAFAAIQDGHVTGYTVVRKCRNGWKIGPLAAINLTIAKQLLEAAGSHATAGEPVFLDVPETNLAAKTLIADFEMTPVFETARMYTGQNPQIDEAKLFGVTTFELG